MPYTWTAPIPMQRVNSEEILDSPSISAEEAELSLRDLCRINRWFGGVATTRVLIERVAAVSKKTDFSLLEIASGLGEVPRGAGEKLKNQGITLDITDLDRVLTHLQRGHRSLVADALTLPFRDSSFDLVSCSLFAHHLQADELQRFVAESLRVCRDALLINDLIRHHLHLALVYAGFPLMRSHVSRVDGVASVRRAYTPHEIREILSRATRGRNKIDISRHYLFRMGIIVWKNRAA
jgi:ubiquinone/menaquinone biosynthesis C-methylase UbiE